MGPRQPESHTTSRKVGVRKKHSSASKKKKKKKNQISGPLPPEWANMTQIQGLSLQDNQISGPLPPQWSRMAKLEELHLDSNLLNGSLPPEWSNMTQLRLLHFPNNQLSGPLPRQWSAMPEQPLLDLRNNSLNGPLSPCDFPRWNASFAQLFRDFYFDFSDNKFSGKMELPCLDVDPCSSQWRKKLDILVLNGNKLCGICDIKC